MLPPIANRQTVRWQACGTAKRVRDALAVEEPLEIRVETRSVAVTMRTPGHDAELAAGFLLTEGVLRGGGDILKVTAQNRNRSGNVIDVFLAPDVVVDFSQLTRHVFASSSCGLCGKASIDAVRQKFKPVKSMLRVPASLLAELPARLRKQQAAFDATGGLHAAALFDAVGKLLVVREDVGRHNAVDKVLGHALLKGWLPLGRHILLVSGRASFEILQKALAAGVPVIAAVSAPSSLAVDFAKANGQTLAGFVRGERLNLYTHPARVQLAK